MITRLKRAEIKERVGHGNMLVIYCDIVFVCILYMCFASAW